MRYLRQHLWLALALILIFSVYLLVIIRSGTDFCVGLKCGYQFWGAHDHDGLWHLAVAGVGLASFPPMVPIFSGAHLANYNYLLDIVIRFIQLLGIPPIITYFKLLPILWVLLFAPLLVKYARALHDSPLFVVLASFTVLLTGPFSQIITLLHGQTLRGSASLLGSPIIHTMTNLQFAFSLVVLLFTLIYLRTSPKLSYKSLALLVFLTVISFALKVYAGMIMGIIIVSYLCLHRSPAQLKHLFVYLSSLLVVSLVGYAIGAVKPSALSAFAWSPLSLVHPITEEPTQFFLRDLTNARYTLMVDGLGPRLLLIEIWNIILFLFFHLGLRVVGLGYWLYLLVSRRIKALDVSIGITGLAGLAIPILFVQRGEWWNTMQFFDYASFLFAWYASIALYHIVQKKGWITKFVVFAIVLFAALPTLDVIHSFTGVSSSYIPREEIVALSKLEEAQRGGVHIIDQKATGSDNALPLPLHLARDTAYVSALSGHPSYYADPYQLQVIGIDSALRQAKIAQADCSALAEVSYLYILGDKASALKNYQNSCPDFSFSDLYSSRDIHLVKIR